jgi:hypothetical protein
LTGCLSAAVVTNASDALIVRKNIMFSYMEQHKVSHEGQHRRRS